MDKHYVAGFIKRAAQPGVQVNKFPPMTGAAKSVAPVKPQIGVGDLNDRMPQPGAPSALAALR